MTKYPIDGLWLTEKELTLYFLGQLEIESHRGARQTPHYQPAPVEADFPQPKKQPAKPVMRVSETRGIEA